jgi:hypothetical protein
MIVKFLHVVCQCTPIKEPNRINVLQDRPGHPIALDAELADE